MKYTNASELPTTIREVLPPEAQALYMQIYNESMELEIAGDALTMPRESMAHQLAWDAVSREFVHDARAGTWYRVGEEPVVEEEEPKGLLQRIRDMF